MTTDRPIVSLIIRAESRPGGPPPYRRLARLLKSMLRAYGWKCLDYRELPAADSKPLADPAPEVPR